MGEEGKKVSWNVAEGLIMEISNRRSLANSYFIQGNIKKALATLISIKQSVIQSFSPTQRETLTAIENKFNRIVFALSATASSSFNSNTKGAYIEAMGLAKKFYSEYNDTLMDLLESYNYLIGEKSDSSKMNF